ncbi:MAG: 5'/3'-nucleotidase SurE [Bacteroidetes bacterium]|nr:MAG: 5'/3'-nucleotidase SurE [Bacteroidota bacterium]
MNKRPLILITNDDGITSPGIIALVEAMKDIGNVVVIAPDKPQSGVGHAITINATLRLDKTNYHNVKKEYSLSGTPVDCVKMATDKILQRKPDLCVSGINHGSNISVNVIYSGTMSAAVEGAIDGIPSVGFSLMDYSIGADFSASGEIAKIIAKNILLNGLPKDICLNVNIPPLKLSEIKGIKVCRQAKANWKEEFDERKDPSGRSYYWLTGEFINMEKEKEDTDVWAVRNNYVSVVPVQFDMTGYSALPALEKWKMNDSFAKKTLFYKSKK